MPRMERIPQQNYRRGPLRYPKLRRHSNHALLFNGTSSYVSVTHAASINIGVGDFFIDCWTYFDTSAPDLAPRIAAKLGLPNVYSLNFLVDRATLFLQNITWDGFTTRNVTTPNNTVTPFAWNHIVLNAVGANQSIYVNSVLRGGPSPRHAVANTGNLIIGSRDAVVGLWKGMLDEFRLGLGVSLTEKQIQDSYLRGYAKRELDARVILRMEENSGPTAFDTSGYGNHGTLLPAPTPPTWVDVSKHELLAEAGV